MRPSAVRPTRWPIESPSAAVSTYCTGILADVLNGAEPRPFWSTHARLEREYEARA